MESIITLIFILAALGIIAWAILRIGPIAEPFKTLIVCLLALVALYACYEVLVGGAGIGLHLR